MHKVIKNILKCDYLLTIKKSTRNTANSQIYNNTPREDSVFSVLNTYFDIYFDVLHAPTGNRYADGIDIRFS